jgi:hypothetical protein
MGVVVLGGNAGIVETKEEDEMLLSANSIS